MMLQFAYILSPRLQVLCTQTLTETSTYMPKPASKVSEYQTLELGFRRVIHTMTENPREMSYGFQA